MTDRRAGIKDESRSRWMAALDAKGVVSLVSPGGLFRAIEDCQTPLIEPADASIRSDLATWPDHVNRRSSIRRRSERGSMSTWCARLHGLIADESACAAGLIHGEAPPSVMG